MGEGFRVSVNDAKFPDVLCKDLATFSMPLSIRFLSEVFRQITVLDFVCLPI